MEALKVETLPFHVSTVTVSRLGAPALQDGLVTVDLADMLVTITAIGDEVGPLDRVEHGAPRSETMLTHLRRQSRIVFNELVELEDGIGSASAIPITGYRDCVTVRGKEPVIW